MRGSREQERILGEYRRRESAVDQDLYAPWNPAEDYMRAGRRRMAAALLRHAQAFPKPGKPVLEIGFGRIGWLSELLGWGLRLEDLHGIELDESRAGVARKALPGADLRVGDAASLPWPEDTFQLVVASTVFTSILDDELRRRIAGEVERTLAPGGALLWYDFRYDNPRNQQVRSVSAKEIRKLFPGLQGRIRSTTLLPPLARRTAPRSFLATACLEAVPFLRSHLVGVLVKPRGINDPRRPES